MIQTEDEVYDDGYLRVEYNNYYVACRNVPMYSLSRKEFFVLTAILRGNGRPVRYQDIWCAVWGETDECKDEVLRAHITNLRRKLTPYGIEITSMIGVGYYLQIRPSDAERFESAR